MSFWNHRVMALPSDDPGGVWYGVHEVHYNDDGSLYAYTLEPVAPCGETLDELRDDLARQLRALDQPILRPADFPKTSPSRQWEST